MEISFFFLSLTGAVDRLQLPATYTVNLKKYLCCYIEV